MTRRFCGLTSVALDLLSSRQRNLIAISRGIRGTRSKRTRHYTEADLDPAQAIKAWSDLLVPLQYTTKQGKAVRGHLNPVKQLPTADTFRDGTAQYLGHGAEFRWFEFTLHLLRPAAIPAVMSAYPVMQAQLLFGLSDDRSKASLELIGQGLGQPLGRAEAEQPFRTLGMGARLGAPDIVTGVNSFTTASRERETVEQFSASALYTICERFLLPRLIQLRATAQAPSSLPPFCVDVTCVSDYHSRVVMTAYPPMTAS